MSRKRRKRRRGITPWKKTLLKFCLLCLLTAAGIHLFRIWKAAGFYDQMEAARWGSDMRSAQVSAFLPVEEAIKEEGVGELEYQINTTLAQDSIKLTSEEPGARLWQDCYSGIGSLTLTAGKKSVTAEAVGTGGAFFTFHPLPLSAGSYYQSDSLMKDEILLDRETAWKLFGAFNVIGRTVKVEDAYLRIAGVYSKEEGSLYEKAGLPQYLVFVQYRTLIKYGSGDAAGTQNTGGSEPAADGQSNIHGAGAADTVPKTAAGPFGSSYLRAAAADEEVEIEEDSGGSGDSATDSAGSKEEDAVSGDSGGDSGTDAAAGSGTGSGGDSGTDAAAGSGTGSGAGAGGGSGSTGGENGSSADSENGGDASDKQNMENVGTANTGYKDTGRITTYEIVMPDPVEGYAAAVLKKALGDESGAVVVDNTNRFGIRSLMQDLRDFAILGMRTHSVRYPYWENAAMGWQTIFAALLLAEGLLILLTIVLLLIMLIHWYTHRTWTLLSTYRYMQDRIYERQSRRRYPEYYRERDDADEDSPEEGRKKGRTEPMTGMSAGGAGQDGIRKDPEPLLLPEKEKVPFERIPENRKAVVVDEKTQKDDQLVDSSGSDAEPGGLRWRKRK